MARDDITSGTSFTGPLYISGTTALPASVDDNSGGTADTIDYTLAAIGDTSVGDESGNINNNFATIAALLDAILERIQSTE